MNNDILLSTKFRSIGEDATVRALKKSPFLRTKTEKCYDL